MGIYNALFTGASGLSAFGETVRVIGDNIANVNTLGFKTQNVIFNDVLSQTLSVSGSNIANQVGNGVRIGQITRDDKQGSIQTTSSATDMAINGRGSFVLKNATTGQVSYSRAGAFFLNKDFNLIDGQGLVVQGWATDTAGVAMGNVKDIAFANLAAQASPTKNVAVGVSIDSTAIAPTLAFNPNDSTTFNYKSDVNVFDSLGNEQTVSLYFVKKGLDANGQSVWDWHASVPGSSLRGADAKTPITPVELGGEIYNTATNTLPNSEVLPINTVFSSDVVVSQPVTFPKGSVVDQFGTASTVDITVPANTSFGAYLNSQDSGISASGLYTLAAAVTPSTAGTVQITAGDIYVPAASSIQQSTITQSKGTLPASLYARNGAIGKTADSNGAGGSFSANALTAAGSAEITFPVGSLQDEKGVLNTTAVVWKANTQFATAVHQNNSNLTMGSSGLFTLVGTGDLLMASSPVTYSIVGQTLPTLNTGATLTATTALGGVAGTNDLIIPAGALQDSAGAVNTSAITLAGGGASTLGTLAGNAGLASTGTYTLISAITNTNTSTIGAGTVTNQENTTTATTSTATPSGSTLPATLPLGAILDGATSVSANITIPASSLKDSTGALVPAANTTWTGAGGQTLDTALGKTGPYTVVLNTIAPAANTTVSTGSLGQSLPTTLFTGTSLTDTTKFGTNSVTFPKGSIKDSAGTLNTAAFTLPAGTLLNDATSGAASAGLSATGPYTLTQSLTPTAGTTLTAGTVTLQTVLSGGFVSNPPKDQATVTGITGSSSQSLAFDANGALVNEFAPQLNMPWNGANVGKITMDMGTAISIDAQGVSGGKGLDGVVQLAGAFATRQMTRDGFASGFLDKLETDTSGVIFGVFTNGQRRPLFQVALASFPNASVLNNVGGNVQQETIASGAPVMEKAGNGGMGTISPFGLEQSNVDLAGEFVKLIVVQRGYEANSKTITTTDQMLSSLMQLKR